jgi:hypothetical protein
VIRPRSFCIAFVVLACVTAPPPPAAAEWFTDIYLGAATTMDEDVTVRISGVSVKKKGEFDAAFTLGVRGGYWFEAVPWLGLAVDASFFNPDADLTVFPVSALLMLRWPLLTSPEFSKGRLQPYLGVGPGVFVSALKSDLRPALEGTFSDTSVDLGLDVRAGLTWMFNKNTGLFAEYRFTHVSPRFSDSPADVSVRIDTELNSHHLLVGVSFRF